MKKLEQLGRKLSKGEQKKIIGGVDDELGGGEGGAEAISHGECDSACNNTGSWNYSTPVTLGTCVHDVSTYCWSRRGYCDTHHVTLGGSCA